jgi:micrococcal nuclease
MLVVLAIAGAVGFGWTSADRLAGMLPPASVSAPKSEPSLPARSFGLCHSGGGRNCVVDGDTFWLDGEKIRIADIDTPETHPPRCAHEAELGARATRLLQALLSAGPITLATADRDTDRYGRKLRVVTRGGESLGDTLVAEGLARPWEGRRRPWC